MMTADDSNSRLWRFQKLRQEIAQRFVGAAFQRWRAQAHLQRSAHHSRYLVLARTRLYSHRKSYGSLSCL
jgi:hypothetical protein